MKVEVTLTIEVSEDTQKWNFVVADALRDIGSEIYINPLEVHSQGESLNYTYEYTVKGRE